MKKIKILVAAILAFFAGNAMAQNITVDDITVEPNGQANLVVKYGDAAAAAAQFDLVLPEGVSLNGRAQSGDLIPGYTVVSKTQADGSTRYLIYSMDGNQFAATSGTLLTIPVTVGDVEEGALEGCEIKNVIVANYDAEKINNVDQVNVNINVGEPALKGDVNADGVVDMIDLDAIVQATLNNDNSAEFDIDGNGRVDAVDVAQEIDIIFPSTFAKGNGTETETVNRLSVNGGTSVALNLDNTSNFRAFQFDLTLPEGLQPSDAQLSSAASGMDSYVNKIGDNTWRVLVAGLDGQAVVAENAGSLVSVAINGSGAGDATLSNILFADVNAVGTTFPNMTLKVQGGTSTGIDGINADTDSDANKAIYSVGGASRKSLQRGVNIVRDATGKVTKVIKK